MMKKSTRGILGLKHCVIVFSRGNHTKTDNTKSEFGMLYQSRQILHTVIVKPTGCYIKKDTFCTINLINYCVILKPTHSVVLGPTQFYRLCFVLLRQTILKQTDFI